MTTTPPTTDTTPRVWIGCLACYNEGRLVGDWYDAITADEITTASHQRGTTLTAQRRQDEATVALTFGCLEAQQHH